MIELPVNARLRDNQKRKTLLRELSKDQASCRLSSTQYSKDSSFLQNPTQNPMMTAKHLKNSGSLFQSNMAQTFQEIKYTTQER